MDEHAPRFAAEPYGAAAAARPSFDCAKPRSAAGWLSWHWGCLLAAMIAGGCTTGPLEWFHNGFKVGPQYAEPPASVASQWIDANDQRVQCTPANDCNWWSVFADPTLDELITLAHRQNLDLQAAGTRILAARAQRGIAVGNLFPQQQSALGAYVHGQIPANSPTIPLPPIFDFWATGLNASWELDFWGRYRRTIEAASAQLDASAAGYNDTLVMLLAEVATSYVQLRTYEQRLQYARRNVEIQTGSMQLAEQRFKSGVASQLDVHQAKSNLAQTESLIPSLIVGRRQANNQLCTLLGLAPSDLASRFAPAPIPTAPATVSVGIPADLLRRRPDIRRAEREVAAQSARIGIAEVDLYPQFSMTGFIGYTARDLKDLFAAANLTGFILPNFQWNVLNYGRIRNNIRTQDAQFQGAALRYQQAVLTAGREVEDALVAFLQAQQQAVSLETSVTEAALSVDLVLEQFKAGATDFNRVYTTQSALVSQQDSLAQARGNIAANLVRVYRAMGGGWQYFCGQPSPAGGYGGAHVGGGGGAAEEIPRPDGAQQGRSGPTTDVANSQPLHPALR